MFSDGIDCCGCDGVGRWIGISLILGSMLW